ncbi:MAG: hypothetical protein HY787_05760 [Deltaproteobacteria bacterium]|nr:hypothetical protein [Deltaproteobacteria bacterium]
MKILLVEPDYRHSSSSFIMSVTNPENKKKYGDESLWYPPIGLLKLATFHRKRGDEVKFVIGCDKTVFQESGLFTNEILWDRIYITTLFTFDWKNIIKTVNFYKGAVGGSIHKIFIGGIMASLMPEDIYEETGIQPVVGILNSPKKIGLDGKENIDQLPPDYSILDSRIYAINDTYYAYTTRGCINHCPWCGVSVIEPTYCNYIDIKPLIRQMRAMYGDKSRLKLMDNNILASPYIDQIVKDLVELGYGRGETTNTSPPRTRMIDFNQGLEATYINDKKISLLDKLNIKPMRIAFDKLSYKSIYINAIRIAREHGFRDFSNYMLYNEKDTPRELYERLIINIGLNKQWRNSYEKPTAVIYSYPMRFAPIKDKSSQKLNRNRDYVPPKKSKKIDFLYNAQWTKRFTRNIEVIKGAAHGAISPTPDLALRAIGETYEEFISNLYMPEELLRHRNKYEARIYANDPTRKPGTGAVENFREFILRLLKKQDKIFFEFHEAVSPCSKEIVRKVLNTSNNKEVREWLVWYLK